MVYCLERGAGSESVSRLYCPVTARRWQSCRRMFLCMPVEVFEAEAEKCIRTGRHPRWQRFPIPTLLTSQWSTFLQYLAPMGTGPTLSLAAAEILWACTHGRSMAFRPSRWLARANGTKFGYDKDDKAFLTRNLSSFETTTMPANPRGFTWRLAAARARRSASSQDGDDRDLRPRGRRRESMKSRDIVSRLNGARCMACDRQ